MKITGDQTMWQSTMIMAKPALGRSFAWVLDAVTKSTVSVNANMAGGAIEPADFTHMTRQGLLVWMNPKIKSGELSLDDTSPLLALTLKMPFSGALAGLDNQDYANFMHVEKDGLVWAQKNNDPSTLDLLQSALEAMQPYQGQGIVTSKSSGQG